MRHPSSDLSQHQYAAIGKVACEWGHAEQTLQRFVGKIAGIPPITSLKITTELGAVTLLNMILALAHEPSKSEDSQPPIYQALKAVSEHINCLRGQRNTVIHQDWMRDGHNTTAIVAMKLQAKGMLQGKILKRTPEEMHKLALQIAALNAKLNEILLDFESGRLVASPSKSRKQPRRDRRNDQTYSGKTQPSR